MASKLIEEIILKVSIDSANADKELESVFKSINSIEKIDTKVSNGLAKISKSLGDISRLNLADFDKSIRGVSASLKGLNADDLIGGLRGLTDGNYAKGIKDIAGGLVKIEKIDLKTFRKNLRGVSSGFRNFDAGNFIKDMREINEIFQFMNTRIKNSSAHLLAHNNKIKQTGKAYRATATAITTSNNRLKQNSRLSKKATTSTKTHTTSLIDLKTAFALLAGIMTGKVVGGLVSVSKEQVNQMVLIDRYASKLGMATKEFQNFSNAAKLFGIDIHEAGQGLKNLTERVADAKISGTGAAFDALKLLGLDPKTLSNLDPIERFIRVSEELNKLSVSDRQFLQLELGEEEMFKISELAKKGGIGIRKMLSEMERLDHAMSELDSKKIREMEFSVGMAEIAFSGLIKKLMVGLAPAIDAIASIFKEMFVTIREGNPFDSLTESVNKFVLLGLNFIEENALSIIETFLSFEEVIRSVVSVFSSMGLAAFETFDLILGALGDTDDGTGNTLTGFEKVLLMLQNIGLRGKQFGSGVVAYFASLGGGIASMVTFAFKGVIFAVKGLWNNLKAMMLSEIDDILAKYEAMPDILQVVDTSKLRKSIDEGLSEANKAMEKNKAPVFSDILKDSDTFQVGVAAFNEIAEIQKQIDKNDADFAQRKQDRIKKSAGLEKSLLEKINAIKDKFENRDKEKKKKKPKDLGLKDLSKSATSTTSSRMDVGSIKAFEFLFKRDDDTSKKLLIEAKKSNKKLDEIAKKKDVVNTKG